MGQSSAGESVRDLLKTSGFIKHSPEIDKLIAYAKTPEYAEEKAAREQAAKEAFEAEERARAELLRARREAVAVRMVKGGTLPYADNREKQSPVTVEAGEVVAVESWEGDGWTAHVGGIGVFVPVRIATPCEALQGGYAVAQGNAQTGEEQASAGKWYRAKRTAVRRAAMAAKASGQQLAVLEEMTDPCPPNRWPRITGGVKSIMAALDMTKYQVSDAMAGLKSKGLIEVCEDSAAHSGTAQGYRFVPALDLPTVSKG